MKTWFFKKVPAFVPGLLFFISIFCYPAAASESNWGSIGYSKGNLLVTQDGYSGFCQSTLLINPGKIFNFGFGVQNASFELANFEAHFKNYKWQFGITTKFVSLDLSIDQFSVTGVRADISRVYLENDGCEDKMISGGLRLKINNFNIRPFFSHISTGFGDGHFYWFFGRPNLDSFWLWGLETAYLNHKLILRYVSVDAQILSVRNTSLFSMDTTVYSAHYRYIAPLLKPVITGDLGFLYLTGNINGALTSSNQPYLWFIYRFYRVDAHIISNITYFSINILHNFSIFELKANFGVLQLINTGYQVDTHYLEKGSQGKEDRERRTNKIFPGTAFLNMDFAISQFPLGQRTSLTIGAKKPLIIPWHIFINNAPPENGTGTTVQPDNGSQNNNTRNLDQLRSLLLTGLSFYINLSF